MKDFLTSNPGIPYFDQILDWPESYAASAIVAQPLALAEKKFGKDTVLKTHLLTLMNMKSWKGFKDWALNILQNAQGEALKSFLLDEFTKDL